MKKKRLFAWLVLAFYTLCVLSLPAGAVSTSAQSAILMEADTGRVLYAQGELERRSIASTTKLMTALVAAERCPDFSETVTVDPAAVGVEGSSLYLAAGEQLPLEHLLYGLLLQSGNDAAVAIAIHCAGDVDTFVDWMNQKAQDLGMTNSHFANPNGLEQEDHYSCAYDLALLGRAVLAHPQLAPIAATASITLGTRTFVNHNKLLRRYEGCVGLKTGFTKKAGRTLVSAARRGGTTLVAVTLNDGNDWADHTALLDYGFGLCHSHLLARGGKTVGVVRVEGSLVPAVAVRVNKDVCYPLLEGETITARWDLPRQVEAPVRAAQTLGSLTFYLNGQEICKADLVAAVAVPRNLRH